MWGKTEPRHSPLSYSHPNLISPTSPALKVFKETCEWQAGTQNRRSNERRHGRRTCKVYPPTKTTTCTACQPRSAPAKQYSGMNVTLQYVNNNDQALLVENGALVGLLPFFWRNVKAQRRLWFMNTWEGEQRNNPPPKKKKWWCKREWRRGRRRKKKDLN